MRAEYFVHRMLPAHSGPQFPRRKHNVRHSFTQSDSPLTSWEFISFKHKWHPAENVVVQDGINHPRLGAGEHVLFQMSDGYLGRERVPKLVKRERDRRAALASLERMMR